MQFVVYTKDGCSYCEKLKKVLKLTNLTFVEYTLNTDFTKEEFYSKFGNEITFPQVICDNKKIGGCIDTIKYLKEKNIV